MGILSQSVVSSEPSITECITHKKWDDEIKGNSFDKLTVWPLFKFSFKVVKQYLKFSVGNICKF